MNLDVRSARLSQSSVIEESEGLLLETARTAARCSNDARYTTQLRLGRKSPRNVAHSAINLTPIPSPSDPTIATANVCHFEVDASLYLPNLSRDRLLTLELGFVERVSGVATCLEVGAAKDRAKREVRAESFEKGGRGGEEGGGMEVEWRRAKDVQHRLFFSINKKKTWQSQIDSLDRDAKKPPCLRAQSVMRSKTSPKNDRPSRRLEPVWVFDKTSPDGRTTKRVPQQQQILPGQMSRLR